MTDQQSDNMISECNFKNELDNIGKSYYKFSIRDLEIKRACYHCRINMDQNNCILSRVYEHRSHNIELNKLFEEINNRKKEIMRIQDYIKELKTEKENKEKEIIYLDKELEILNNNVVKIRANDFLRTTIGGENYLFYIDNGYIDITGTNNSIYRITNKGIISKTRMKKKGLVDKLNTIFLPDYQKRYIETLSGQIKATNYPLEDAIAIVCTHIMRDSDKFDKDKGCGSIFIDRI